MAAVRLCRRVGLFCHFRRGNILTKDFSKEPISIAQIKAEKAGDCSLWGPRDILIDVLRRLDNGNIVPTRMIICYREGEPDDPHTSYTICGDDVLTHVGMLERVKQLLMEGLS